MAEVELTQTEKLGLACSYAALILHDGKQPVTGSNLQKITSAAGIELDNFWSGVFENVLSNFDLSKLLENSLGGGSGGSAPVTTTTATTTSAPTEAPKQEVKEEVKEEESASIGGLFGSDDD